MAPKAEKKPAGKKPAEEEPMAEKAPVGKKPKAEKRLPVGRWRQQEGQEAGEENQSPWICSFSVCSPLQSFLL
jgi:hypothetical protein